MMRNILDVRHDVVMDYDPLSIEEYPALKIYFDMMLNRISDEEIQSNIREDCVCPDILLTPTAISPNDWGRDSKNLLILLKAYMKQAFGNHVTQFPLTGTVFYFGVKNNVQHQGCKK